MERRDVRIKALHRTGEDELVQLRRWQCLVEPRPTTIPWLELGAGQARLDLHHAIPEIVEGPLVGAGRALEVQPDLEPPCARVMPDLEVELGMAVMELDQAAVAAARLEGLQLLRKPRLDALAEPRKEVCGGQRGATCQPPDYIFSYSFGSGLHPDGYGERRRQPRALIRHLLAAAQGPHHPHRPPHRRR